MTNKWIMWLVILIVIIGVYFYISQNKKVTNTGETIKIGAVLGLTGAAAADSLSVKRGLDMAVEDLAKKGVIVEINYQDDGTDAKKTVSSMQYLATIKPQAVIGPIWSFLEEAAGPVIAQNKLVAYAPADTSEFVSVRSYYNFRGAPLNALIEKPLTEWLKSNKKTRVAIITSNDGWGISVKKPFENAAKSARATIVINEDIQSFSPSAALIAGTIMAKVKAANADVILWTGYEQDAVTIAKKREEFGIDAPIVDAGTIYQNLISRGTIPSTQAKNAYELSVPTSQEFKDKFMARYGEIPTSYADRAYDGLMILVEAIQNSPTGDSDAVAKYLHEETRYKGYGGVYEFNENGDVKGGTWVIKPITKS